MKKSGHYNSGRIETANERAKRMASGADLAGDFYSSEPWRVTYTPDGRIDGFRFADGEPEYKLFNGANTCCRDTVRRLNAHNNLIAALRLAQTALMRHGGPQLGIKGLDHGLLDTINAAINTGQQ